VQVNKASDERIVEDEIAMLGEVTGIGDHSIEVTLLPKEREKLAPIIERARTQEAEEPAAEKRLDELEDKRDDLEDKFRDLDDKQSKAAADLTNQLKALQAQLDEARRKLMDVSLSTKRSLRVVDADRLIAWQLYWRGEQFWSGGEIWAYSPSNAIPEMKTSFVNTNNVEFQKYINDRTRAPLGRRYFVITEAGRITGVRAMLPTQRGRDSFEVLDTTSNKFSIAAFYL
jgi:hypothetical protein